MYKEEKQTDTFGNAHNIMPAKIKKEIEHPPASEAEILDGLEISDSENPDTDFSELGYCIKDSIYVTRQIDRKNNVTETEQSNFVMRCLYNITNGSNNSRRLIFVQRKPRQKGDKPEKKLLEVKSSELKPEAFEVILKSHGCTFLGTAYLLKKIFANLMDEEETATIITMLGWNEDYNFYAFADSVFTFKCKFLKSDHMGIVQDEGKTFYLPATGLANQTNEDYANDKAYNFRPGTIDFKTWSKLFYQASGNKAIVGILYTVLAIFRDLIFTQLNFFPFLYLFGEKGTGKTSFIHPLLQLFGSDSKGTPLNNATIVALSRIVSSRCNSLFYFKEYTTETDHMAEDFILSGYDGAGRETGVKSNDTKTKKFPIRSGIIFDGNSLPRKSNILSRMILLTFESTTFTEHQKEAFNELREKSQNGFGSVFLEILHLRLHVENELKDNFTLAKKSITQVIQNSDRYPAMRNADERILQHTYLLYSIFLISKEHLAFPFKDGEVLDAVLQIGESTMQMLQRTDSVTVFWEALAYSIIKAQVQELTVDGYSPSNKKTASFWIKDKETEVPSMLIKFPQIYPHYVKYCKDNGIRYLDYNSMLSILTSGNNQSFVPGRQKGRGKAQTVFHFGSCYEFTMQKSDTENDTSLFLNGVEFQH
ncbi:MAG TPA: hypothetical protein VFC92_03510 [Bacteroidales bacterium]|nr:hypothetical protein [Bacteroidales bacterium]